MLNQWQRWFKNQFCTLRARTQQGRHQSRRQSPFQWRRHWRRYWRRYWQRALGFVLVAAATGGAVRIFFSQRLWRAHMPTTTIPTTAVAKTAGALHPLSVSRVSSVALVAPIRRFLTQENSQGESPQFERAMRLALKLQMEPRRDDASENEVRRLAKNLKNTELSELSAVALNEDINANRRNAAIYILTMAGDHAMEQLAEVVTQPVHPFPQEQSVHSRGSLQKKYEVALRVRALEELDRLTVSSPPDVKKETATRLSRIVAQQKQPTLQFLAQLSLQGVLEGHPGKLNRFEEKAFAQEKKQ